jgi:hypothetical protein
MDRQVAVVIVPRDRLSSISACVASVLKNTEVPFRLVIIDLGYPKKTIDQLRSQCAGVPTEFLSVGRTIPMLAFKQFLPSITEPYLAWVDNDTFVTPGWMTALLERARQGARVILPLTLEREGLDVDKRDLPLRNHISHAELRRVTVDGVSYVFDHKPFRRAAPEELPQEPHTVDYFELHAFFAETQVMRDLDLPAMVVREHIDLGMQLHQRGIDIWCEPKSRVIFDNIHERPSFADLRFFFYRWAEHLIDESHDLFEKRWGYRFYSEQSIKNWAYRRKVFSVCRFLGLPNKLSDLASRAFNKAFRARIPAQLAKDPLPESERVMTPRVASPQPVAPALAER